MSLAMRFSLQGTFQSRRWAAHQFDMPLAKSQAMEPDEPGKCPKCGAANQMQLKRTQQRQ
jgi:hypothetical protein